MYGMQRMGSTAVVRKLQSHEPPGFDICTDVRFRHSGPSETGEEKLVPRCLITDAPGIETDDADVLALRRRLL